MVVVPEAKVRLLVSKVRLWDLAPILGEVSEFQQLSTDFVVLSRRLVGYRTRAWPTPWMDRALCLALLVSVGDLIHLCHQPFIGLSPNFFSQQDI